MNIEKLATNFRNAIERAHHDGCFKGDLSFNKFPLGCCGDTSDLLAQYLQDSGIRTYYVCGTYKSGDYNSVLSHAWLQTKNGKIIDITGDQFKDNGNLLSNNISVFVGFESSFHELFDVAKRDVRLTNGLISLGTFCQQRLLNLYAIIISYI